MNSRRWIAALLLAATSNTGSPAQGEIVVPTDPFLKGCVAERVAAIRTDARRAPPPAIAPFPDPPVVAEKVTDLERLKAHAKVISLDDPRSAQELASLKDGVYLFVFDDQRRCFVIARDVPPLPGKTAVDDPTYLGSHTGLVKLAESLGGKPVQVISAGEVRLRDGGFVASISNQAGNYHGSKEHLNYAKGEFSDMGLPIDSRTNIVNFSTSDPRHVKSLAILEIERKYRSDPTLSSLLEDARETMRAFARGGKAGRDALRERALDDSVAGLAYTFESQWAKWPEPDFAILDTALNDRLIGEQKLREILVLIRQFSPRPSVAH